MERELVRVSVVEDESLFRVMLGQSLASHPRLRLVHSVSGAQEATIAITRGSTDVAVLDINLADGNGIALGLALQRIDPRIGILLLSSQDSLSLFHTIEDEMTEPWSYLSKRSSFTLKVLHNAVLATARGEIVIDPYLVRKSTPRSSSAVSTLTPAQFNVLSLVAEGLSNDKIARQLSISPRSVESHLLAVYKQLGLDGQGTNRRVSATLAFIDQTSRSRPE